MLLMSIVAMSVLVLKYSDVDKEVNEDVDEDVNVLVSMC